MRSLLLLPLLLVRLCSGLVSHFSIREIFFPKNISYTADVYANLTPIASYIAHWSPERKVMMVRSPIIKEAPNLKELLRSSLDVMENGTEYCVNTPNEDYFITMIYECKVTDGSAEIVFSNARLENGELLPRASNRDALQLEHCKHVAAMVKKAGFFYPYEPLTMRLGITQVDGMQTYYCYLRNVFPYKAIYWPVGDMTKKDYKHLSGYGNTDGTYTSRQLFAYDSSKYRGQVAQHNQNGEYINCTFVFSGHEYVVTFHSSELEEELGVDVVHAPQTPDMCKGRTQEIKGCGDETGKKVLSAQPTAFLYFLMFISLCGIVVYFYAHRAQCAPVRSSKNKRRVKK
ncbi:ORF141 [Ranid herpesvirus 2]|uniref:ORF141 n=1 Tax=Ranid herpesvirus 2 TaxID=389214 RepID=Q14VW5_9VIRU|nr:ORF141 [Ranid herpesvirus 2]ABG25630.1 ORF141 [Ranid herpesvirus 2]